MCPPHCATRVDLRRRTGKDILRWTALRPLTPHVYTSCVRMYTMYNVYIMNMIVCVWYVCLRGVHWYSIPRKQFHTFEFSPYLTDSLGSTTGDVLISVPACVADTYERVYSRTIYRCMTVDIPTSVTSSIHLPTLANVVTIVCPTCEGLC